MTATRQAAVLLVVLVAWPPASRAAEPMGARGPVGCLAAPRQVGRLLITRPGVYENYLVDGNGAGGNLVKITADRVTLRHCEVRNGSGNGVGIFAPNILVENCRIHHMLAGTFDDQRDAHGITGRWGNVVIRNCEISQVSGDAIQFDPDRQSAGSVLIENCSLSTGPLSRTAQGSRKGQRPGENAVDTKTRPDGPRCELVIRNCYLHGWNQPGQISNIAALNLKENVAARVTHCLLNDNEIAFRLRGPGKNGGAQVSIDDCLVYNSKVGVRAENRIEQLKITSLAFGNGVAERIRFVPAGPGPGPGYENHGQRKAPPWESLIESGLLAR